MLGMPTDTGLTLTRAAAGRMPLNNGTQFRRSTLAADRGGAAPASSSDMSHGTIMDRDRNGIRYEAAPISRGKARERASYSDWRAERSHEQQEHPAVYSLIRRRERPPDGGREESDHHSGLQRQKSATQFSRQCLLARQLTGAALHK